MSTITRREFAKLFSQELKEAGFLPCKYCTITNAGKILRCYYKTVLRCLAAGNEIMIKSWGKFCPGKVRSGNLHNPRTGKHEETTFTGKPQFLFSKPMAIRFKAWCDGDIATLDDVLGKEIYNYRENLKKRKMKEKKK